MKPASTKLNGAATKAIKPASFRLVSNEGSGSRRTLSQGLRQSRSPVTTTGCASCLQKCGDLLQVQAVEDALWRDAAFAGHQHAPAGEIDLIRRVCVRVDAEYAAEFEGSPVPPPVHVEPVRVRIDFDSDPVLGAGPEDRVNVDLVARSAQQHAARQVAENRREGI